MLLEKLFLIPNSETNIIEILIHIFIYSLYQKSFLINHVKLIPTNNEKRIFLFSINDSILYSSLPEYWNIKIMNNSMKINCPFEELHFLIHFIEKLISFSVYRKNFKVMNHLNFILSEFLKEIQFDCKFCNLFKKEINQIESEKNYLELFYTSILESDENLDEIKKIHNQNVKIIEKQLRSEKIIFNIFNRFALFFNESFQEFSNHPDQCLKIKINLKNKFQNYVMNNVPFLSLKNINFMDWIDQLLLLKCNLKEFKNDNEKTLQYIIKLVFILQMVFPENRNEKIDKIYFNNQKINFNKNNIKEMYEYHPILRGDYFLTIQK